MDAIKSRYPDFVIPERGLIESMLQEGHRIVEASGSDVMLDPGVLWLAARKAQFFPDPPRTRAERLLKRFS